MVFVQSSNIYASTDDPITSITVQKAKRFKKLLVIIHSNYQSAYTPEEFVEWVYFNYGTEVNLGGVFNNTPTYACRMFLVDVTAATMTFSDMRCYGYQVWGFTEGPFTLLKQYSVTNQPGKNIPSLTSIDLSDTNYKNYDNLLVLIGMVKYSGVNESSMRQSLYITGKTEAGYSGNFVDTDSSSSLLLGFIIPSNQINNTLTGVSAQIYAVFGIREYTKAAGDIKAIGDWFKSTRYLKEEIDDFFVQNNDYTPYQLTFYDESDSTVTITGQTSGESYTIDIANGEVTKLLFFTAGETVVATDGENTITKVLSNQVDEIVLVTPEISLVLKAENQPTTNGAVKDYTYTAEKSGYYLILYWEFMNIQLITELEDVLISGQVIDNYGSPHMKYWICHLDAGDEVLTRITTSDQSGRYFYSALIFKLDGIIDRNSVELYTTFDRQDGNTSYDISTDSYKHLIFTSWQTDGNGGDQTDTSVKKGEAMMSSIVSAWPNYSNYKVTTCIYYGDKTNLPTPIKNYSWNWGRGQLVDIITKK